MGGELTQKELMEWFDQWIEQTSAPAKKKLAEDRKKMMEDRESIQDDPNIPVFPLTSISGYTERITVALENIAFALQTLAKIEPKPEKRKEAQLGTAKYDKRSAVEKEVHEHFAASGGLPKPKR